MKKRILTYSLVVVIVLVTLQTITNIESYSRSDGVVINELKQVKTALDLYSLDYGGRYPDSLDELLSAEVLSEGGCSLLYEQVEGKEVPRFTYVKGLTNTSEGETVILYGVSDEYYYCARVNGVVELSRYKLEH